MSPQWVILSWKVIEEMYVYPLESHFHLCQNKYNLYPDYVHCLHAKPLTVYLKQKDRQNYSSNSVHQPHVIVDQGFSATTNEDVEFFGLVVVVVVGGVVGDFVLDTGSGRTRVTATEGHTVNQVTAIHIALNAAGRLRRKWKKRTLNHCKLLWDCCSEIYHSSLKTFLLHAFYFIVLTQKIVVFTNTSKSPYLNLVLELVFCDLITSHQPRGCILTWILNAFLWTLVVVFVHGLWFCDYTEYERFWTLKTLLTIMNATVLETKYQMNDARTFPSTNWAILVWKWFIMDVWSLKFSSSVLRCPK